MFIDGPAGDGQGPMDASSKQYSYTLNVLSNIHQPGQPPDKDQKGAKAL